MFNWNVYIIISIINFFLYVQVIVMCMCTLSFLPDKVNIWWFFETFCHLKMVEYKKYRLYSASVWGFLNAHMLLLRPILTTCRCERHDMQKRLHIIGRCDAENYFFHCHSMPLFVLESLINKPNTTYKETTCTLYIRTWKPPKPQSNNWQNYQIRFNRKTTMWWWADFTDKRQDINFC